MGNRPRRLNSHTSRIATFRTIDEEAEFWDTHDSTEFEDEFEVVTDVKFVAAQPNEPIVLTFDDEVLAALTAKARELKTSPATLARKWVLERLQTG
ncbi:MAG: CopG family antitoxin [Thermomicrobiales bacterium]